MCTNPNYSIDNCSDCGACNPTAIVKLQLKPAVSLDPNNKTLCYYDVNTRDLPF